MNEKTKHTPGPWRYRLRGSGKGCDVLAGEGRQVEVVAYDVHGRTAEADAALIAAAPDLLDALRLAEEWLVSVGADGSPLTAVRAAIAKAEGRS